MTSKNKLLKKGSSNKEDICIALVGPVGCGKSAILVKYFTRRYIGEYDPFYEGCWTKHETVDNTEFNVQIMDTYDKDRRNLDKHLRWSDTLVVVYSIVSNESFLAAQDYLENISEILKKNEEANEKKFVKIVLLGNKIDLERYRQVSKADVETLLRKYSSVANAIPSSIGASSTTTTKFYDSTNTLTNDNQLNAAQSTTSSSSSATTTISAVDATTPTPLVYNLNLTHLETTCCEEYEFVHTVIVKIIRDTKKEKDAYLQANQPIHTASGDENSMSMGSSFSSSSKKITSKFINTKRAKSPKSTAVNVVVQPQPHHHHQQTQDSPIGSLSIAGSPLLATNSSSTNPTTTVSSSPLNSHLLLSNDSFSSLSTTTPSVNSSEVESFIAPSATASLIKDAKKNSSKFPFFTKILNKANNSNNN